MLTLKAAAYAEVQAILQQGRRSVKVAIGVMVKRQDLIANGTEPLALAEFYNAGPSGASSLFEVEYLPDFLARVVGVYETAGQDVTVLAVDAFQLEAQGWARVGLPGTAPDARARAWARAI